MNLELPKRIPIEDARQWLSAGAALADILKAEALRKRAGSPAAMEYAAGQAGHVGLQTA